MPPAKHHMPFNIAHITEFGLKIMERDPNTKAVVSVRCQFCVFNGREELHPEKVRKRVKTDTIMSWQGTFRTDYYQKHLNSQHCTVWATYQLLSYDQKNAFFIDVKPFKETLPHHFDSSYTEPSLIFTIESPIIDIIISQMFFNPTEQDTPGQVRALKLFKRMSDVDMYEVAIKNRKQFQLCIGQISRGNSFRQIAGNLTSIKDIIGPSGIGSVTEEVVSNYARQISAISLQRLMIILRENKSIWAFSLANDASTHWGSSYLDNRIRFQLRGKLYDIHAIAIPIFEQHTGINMFRLITRFLDIICPIWRQKLLGVASDGASVMTGEFQGVVTRIEKEIPHKVRSDRRMCRCANC